MDNSHRQSQHNRTIELRHDGVGQCQQHTTRLQLTNDLKTERFESMWSHLWGPPTGHGWREVGPAIRLGYKSVEIHEINCTVINFQRTLTNDWHANYLTSHYFWRNSHQGSAKWLQNDADPADNCLDNCRLTELSQTVADSFHTARRDSGGLSSFVVSGGANPE